MSSELKKMRGQVRQIVQELHPELVKSEAFQTHAKDFREKQVEAFKTIREAEDRRLDALEENVKGQMTKMNERSRAIEGFLMREVKVDIFEKQHNMLITMLAWQDVMQERLNRTADLLYSLAELNADRLKPLEPETQDGLRESMRLGLNSLFGDREEFNAAIDRRKLEVKLHLEQEAEARMNKAIADRQAAEETPATAEVEPTPVTEAPSTPVESEKASA